MLLLYFYMIRCSVTDSSLMTVIEISALYCSGVHNIIQQYSFRNGLINLCCSWYEVKFWACDGVVARWRCAVTTHSWVEAYRTYLASYLWNTSSSECVIPPQRHQSHQLMQQTVRQNAVGQMMYLVSYVTMARDFHEGLLSRAYTAMLLTAQSASEYDIFILVLVFVITD